MWGERCQEESLETTPEDELLSEVPPAAESPPGHRFPGPGSLDRALALVRFLRRECPWDREQTAQSLVPHLLEETHEVVDAIHTGDTEALEGELGDLLLNLAFQIVVAEEARTLDADSVYGRLEQKMVARHPHLFGGGSRQDWEILKAAERADGEGVLSGLAGALDPLTKAYRMQERVAAVGFDWEDHRGARDKVVEELAEVTEALGTPGEAGGTQPSAGETQPSAGKTQPSAGETQPSAGETRPEEGAAWPKGPAAERVEEELGDLLFAVVNLTRLAGAHPTTALARANRKFQNRFEGLERLARERSVDLRTATLAELDALWDEVKRG